MSIRIWNFGGINLAIIVRRTAKFCLRFDCSVLYNVRMTNLELMRLSDNDDEDAFEQEDFPALKKSAKDAYDEFYDDVKQPSRYIKEDW